MWGPGTYPRSCGSSRNALTSQAISPASSFFLNIHNFFLLYIFYLCVCVLSLGVPCVCVKAKSYCQSPWAWIYRCGCWKSNSSPVQEQRKVFTTELSVQPPLFSIYCRLKYFSSNNIEFMFINKKFINRKNVSYM